MLSSRFGGRPFPLRLVYLGLPRIEWTFTGLKIRVEPGCGADSAAGESKQVVVVCGRQVIAVACIVEMVLRFDQRGACVLEIAGEIGGPEAAKAF